MRINHLQLSSAQVKHIIEGKPAQEMVPGVVITIPAEVKHWHGAKKDSWFSHLAIGVPGQDASNEWLEPVDQADYEAL